MPSFIAGFFCSIICLWNLFPMVSIAVMNLYAIFVLWDSNETSTIYIFFYGKVISCLSSVCSLQIMWLWKNFSSLSVTWNWLTVDFKIWCFQYESHGICTICRYCKASLHIFRNNFYNPINIVAGSFCLGFC